jgi:hypothetical protein
MLQQGIKPHGVESRTRVKNRKLNMAIYASDNYTKEKITIKEQPLEKFQFHFRCRLYSSKLLPMQSGNIQQNQA